MINYRQYPVFAALGYNAPGSIGDMSNQPLSKKVRSFFWALLVISTATIGGVIFADYYLATDRNSRSVRSEIAQLEGWISSLNIYIVAVVIAVVVLVGLAIYARNKA